MLIMCNLDNCASTQRIIMGLSIAKHSDGDRNHDELILDHLLMKLY